MISRPCREKSAIQDAVDQQSCEKWTALRDPAWCLRWDDETPEKCQGKRCGFVRKGSNANKLTGKTIKIDTQKKRWRVCVQWFRGKKNNVQLNWFIRVEAHYQSDTDKECCIHYQHPPAFSRQCSNKLLSWLSRFMVTLEIYCYIPKYTATKARQL